MGLNWVGQRPKIDCNYKFGKKKGIRDAITYALEEKVDNSRGLTLSKYLNKMSMQARTIKYLAK